MIAERIDLKPFNPVVDSHMTYARMKDIFDIEEHKPSIGRVISALASSYYDASRPMLDLTLLGGRTINRLGPEYSYEVEGEDLQPRVTILSHPVALGSTPGRDGFITIEVSTNRFQEPDILAVEDITNQPPLEVVGFPEPTPAGSIIRLRVQGNSDNPLSYVDPSQLAINKTLKRISSSVPNEMNLSFSSLTMGGSGMYRNHIQYYAGGMQFSDRALLAERAAAKNNVSNHNSYYFANFTFGVERINKSGETEVANSFVNKAELMIMRQVTDDVDQAMTFGRKSKIRTPISTQPQFSQFRSNQNVWKYTTPGIYQYLLEAPNMQQSIEPNVQELIDFIEANFTRSLPYGQRNVKVITGDLGIKLATTMIEKETVGWIRDVTDQEFNAPTNYAPQGVGLRRPQYTAYISSTGVMVEFIVDPSMNDPRRYPIKHPVYSDYTLVAGDYLILDVGPVMMDGATVPNIAMIRSPDEDYFFHTSALVDKEGNRVQNGASVPVPLKGWGVNIETNGGLFIGDVSRIGHVKTKLV